MPMMPFFASWRQSPRWLSLLPPVPCRTTTAGIFQSTFSGRTSSTGSRSILPERFFSVAMVKTSVTNLASVVVSTMSRSGLTFGRSSCLRKASRTSATGGYSGACCCGAKPASARTRNAASFLIYISYIPGKQKGTPLARGPSGISVRLLDIGDAVVRDGVDADRLGGLAARRARDRDALVLVDAVAADADRADQLAPLIERHAAREFDDAVLAVRVPDVPQRAAGLRQGSEGPGRQRVLVAREGDRRERLGPGDVDAAQPGVGHRTLADEAAAAIEDDDMHPRGLLFALGVHAEQGLLLPGRGLGLVQDLGQVVGGDRRRGGLRGHAEAGGGRHGQGDGGKAQDAGSAGHLFLLPMKFRSGTGC